MKLTKLAVVLAAFALLAKANAQSVSVNFNNPGDYLNNFNLYQNTTTPSNPPITSTTNPYQESTSAGIGGTGGISIVPSGGSGTFADSTSIYKNTSFDFSTAGSALSISSFVKIGTTTDTGNRLLQLGFANESTSGMNGNTGLAFISLRFNPPNPAGGTTFTPQWQTKTAASGVANNSGTVNGGSANLSLTTGDWYNMSLTFRNNGGGSIVASGSMQDFGTDGLTPGTVNTIDQFTLTSADIAADPTVWPAFRAFAADGAVALDNFTAVPEPSTFALLGLAGAAVAYARRRK